MQVPRDLSRRMLEAAEQTPVVDVHERLVPESERVNQRVDFLAWLLAYARPELQSLGLGAERLSTLGDVQADPRERWASLAPVWPYVRTTAAGRTVLRVAWELFGVDEVNERTWKDISARMWKASEKGFYRELLAERANVRMTLVDNQVDPATRACCAPVVNCDRLLMPLCRTHLEELSSQLDVQFSSDLNLLDALVSQSVQRDLDAGCVAFKVGVLPEVAEPAEEHVSWALGRVLNRESAGPEEAVPVEPSLHGYLLHRFLAAVAPSGCPVQVYVDSEVTVERLRSLVRGYEQVPFACLYAGGANPVSLLRLARALPNVTLAMAEPWRLAPALALQSLRSWLQGVPLSKIFAVAGSATMVEAVCAQAMRVRERVAALLAEMVASGDLDEGDALLVLERILHGNAWEYFRLEGSRAE